MQKLNLKYNTYQQWLWSKSKKDDSLVQKFVKNILQVASALIADIKQGQLSLRAMSLVYTTIISIVPLFAISFSVLKGLGAHKQIRPFLLSALEPLGDKGVDISDKIIGFVDNIQVGVLGALGIAILIYTVLGMMKKIELSFNYVWHVSKPRSFAKRFNHYLSVLLIGPLLIFLSTAMTASYRSSYLIEKIGKIAGLDILLTLIGVVIPYLLLALAFTFLYDFVPNTKVKLKAAFISGLMTAFIWKIMGWGFANFIANSAGNTAIYSAFATIIVFMVWIHLVWLVLLIGSSIGFYIQHPEYRKVRHESLNISPALKEAVALQIMVEIGKRFNNHASPANIAKLSEISGQPQRVIEEVTQCLKDANLIINAEENQAWLPSRPIAHVNSYEIINSVRKNTNKSEPASLSNNVKQYTQEIDSVLKQSFQSKTLQQLIEEL